MKTVFLKQIVKAANLFLVTLDDAGGGYRYHQLFADFLRNLFPPPLVARERAAAWFAGDRGACSSCAGGGCTSGARGAWSSLRGAWTS